MKYRYLLAFLVFMILIHAGHAQTIISTLAGTGTHAYSGDGGAASAAALSNPCRVAYDIYGNLYCADFGNHTVRKITTTGIITTIAGKGTAGYLGDGGAATDAYLNTPQGLAFDKHGNLYIADAFNHCIRKINTSGIISTITSNSGVPGYWGDGGPATAAQLHTPYEVALDTAGNIYIADCGNHAIRKITTDGIMRTIAGTGVPGYTGDGIAATASMLHLPIGVAVDTPGNVYIADEFNYRVRKVDPAGIITTIAGTGTSGFSGDGGPATAASMDEPRDVQLHNGALYICDLYNSCIRKVSSSGVISRVAGTGFSGYSGDGGPALAARLNFPTCFRIAPNGNMYIADCFNARIRVLRCGPVLGEITAPTAICLGTNLALTDTTAGGTWSSSDNSIATVGSSGNVTSVSGGTVIISYSKSNSCGTTAAVAVITVDMPLHAKKINGPDTICMGHSIILSDTVTGGTWISNNTAIATITSSGVASGLALGNDTILYVLSNTCGSDTARRTVHVRPDINCISGLPLQQEGPEEVSIIPNPNHGRATIRIAGTAGAAEVIITNTLGQRLYEWKQQTNEEREVNFSVTPGIYFVTVRTVNNIISRRMVVE